MFLTCLSILVLSIVTSTESVPRRLNPQCRSNVCDDRPECPRTSCSCLFPSRMDCALYYQCVNGKPFQYRCSPGLLFNNETLTCDYSYNVKCSDSTNITTPIPIVNTTSSVFLSTTVSPENITENATTPEPTPTTSEEMSKIPSTTVSSENSDTETTEREFVSSSTTEVPTTTDSISEGTTTKMLTSATTVSETDEITTTAETAPESSAPVTSTIQTSQESTLSTQITTIAALTDTTFSSESTIAALTNTTFSSESTIAALTNTTFSSESTIAVTTEETSERLTSETEKEHTTIKTTLNVLTTTPPTDFVTEKITEEYNQTKETETATDIPITEASKSTETTTLKEHLTTTELKSSSGDNLVTNYSITSTDFPSTASFPPSKFICPTRFGLFADPKSCFRFYHCSHWEPYHKWCPSNLHFNPRLRVCDWPYRAGCDSIAPTSSEPKNTTTTTLNPGGTEIPCDCDYCNLPVLKDCTAFIQCIDRDGSRMHCSPRLYFNPKTGTCDLEDNVICPEQDFRCPNPFGRYSVQGSCSDFIECQNGEQTIRKCPQGLQFNQSSEMCSWVGSCTDNQDSLPASQTGDAVSDIAVCGGCSYCFKPSTSDCAKYIRCLQGAATEERCSKGLFFNPITEMCDHDYDVQCPEPQTQPECPEMFGYFPYPGECGKYLHCVNGSATVKSCSGVLHFDPVKKHCDWPWAAGCNDSDSRPTSNSTDEMTDCDCDCCLKPVGSDCRSFILCINKVGFRGSCSSGLRFNPYTENCDFAENVDCSVIPEIPGYSCPEHQGLFPHPEDCRKFIHCAHGYPYVKDCPSNLHFNPKLKVCDWPSSAGCQAYPTSAPPTDDNSFPCDICDTCFIPDASDCALYVYCLNGTGHKLRCTENLYFNSDTETCDEADNVKCPSQPPSQCPKLDGLFPAKDCSQFVHCSNGIAYLKDCPDGLLFNPQILVCDWPENVKCGEVPVKPTLPPIDDGDSDAYNHTCNCDCCFFPHDKDCSKYILCLDDEVHVGQCSRGLLFNPAIQNCDLADRVTCGEDSPLCPEPNGLFPNEEECSSFIKCSNGVGTVEFCMNGKHFSAEKKQCLDPCKARCDDSYNCDATSSSTSSIPSTTTLSPNCPERDGLFPNNEDCSSFYQCSEGRPYLVKCPYGLHFSEKDLVCDYPCEAKCNTSIACASPSTSVFTTSTVLPSTTISPHCLASNGLFSNKENCSSFYQCSDGRAYLIACPSGLHFSEEYKGCDYPCRAKCNSTINCDSTTPNPPVTPSEPSSTTSSPFCPEKDGLFPNKDNCSTYYQCFGGRAYLLSCPSGLHFSYKQQYCDYPCEVKCDTTINCSPTTPESTSPGPSSHCPTPNGLHPVNDDCTAFYMCSNGKEYLIHCPPGLHYSEHHETCEEPCNARCNTTFICQTSIKPVSSTPHPSSPECVEPDGLFPNPDDCGSFFQCSNGQSHLIRCPSDFHFSLEDSACEKPCVAGCNISTECPPEIPDSKGNCTCDNCYLPDPNDCSAFYYCEDGQLSKSYCPFGTLFSKMSTVCEDEELVDCEYNGDPSMCPEEYGFFPYPGDCKKFVHCDDGVAHVKECQDDLEYDPQHRVCTKPKGYCGEIVVDPNCPEPTGLFSDKSNCSVFYQCEHGVAYTKQCSSPLVFNPENKVCDWPDNVDCGKDIKSSTTPAFSTSTQPSVNASTPYITPSTSPAPTPPECHEVPGVICPCACRVPTYDECSSYLQCLEDGTACKTFCPEGLYFNKREMVCDLPENVECRDFFFTAIRRAKQFSHRVRT